jgi:hypothetical protein
MVTFMYSAALAPGMASHFTRPFLAHTLCSMLGLVHALYTVTCHGDLRTCCCCSWPVQCKTYTKIDGTTRTGELLSTINVPDAFKMGSVVVGPMKLKHPRVGALKVGDSPRHGCLHRHMSSWLPPQAYFTAMCYCYWYYWPA